MQIENVFSDVEFDNWAYPEGLFPFEAYLIDKYLDRSRQTIEAGTGGGRILLELQKKGFNSLLGFDCEPKMIEVARRRDKTDTICFEVQNATKLSYEDNGFDQVIYLQQVLSFIDKKEDRNLALREAYRILKTGGTAIFAVLCFNSRAKKIDYLIYLIYISLFRKFSNSPLEVQTLPWLKHNDKPHWGALVDRSPYTYWFKISEMCQLLESVGFKVDKLGTEYQIQQDKLLNSGEDLEREPLKGHLYIVCHK